MFTDEQVMLCLAGISYRGFYEVGLGRPADEHLRAAIERGLNTLAPLRDSWDLVWGPAYYRGPLSLFDEKLVYVVRERNVSQRYVVVVRGTNPISAADWLFGDLWTGRQTAWRYGGGQARVSLSAALSLAIVQGLRSQGPRHDATARIWDSIDARLTRLRDEAHTLARPLYRLTDAALEPLRRQFLQALQHLAAVEQGAGRQTADEARLSECLDLWRSTPRKLLFEVIDRVAAVAGDHLDRLLLSWIERDALFRNSLGSGSDLRSFLAAAVEDASGPVDVIVAGHSKAGALASTVALWLAETQGDRVAEAERWDPGRRARVHCYSYAGPTAGNAEFARRSDSLLGSRCHRTWNRLDIVPYAWGLTDLTKVPDLYLPDIGRVGLVADLVDAIQQQVRPLSYTQIGGVVHELNGKLAPEKPYFFAQLAHQHFDAYLAALDLTQYGITQAVLFDEVASAA
jgi:Lipase (class 3)